MDAEGVIKDFLTYATYVLCYVSQEINASVRTEVITFVFRNAFDIVDETQETSESDHSPCEWWSALGL